jgi:DNA-binding CsgD family transcriptional regulator
MTRTEAGDRREDLDALSRSQLRGVLATVEAAASAESAPAYRRAVVEGTRSLFGCDNVTFFAGTGFQNLFDDPAALLTGDIAGLMDEWQARWKTHDIFASTAARRQFARSGFASLAQLSALPEGRRSYVEGYLRPHRMTGAAALHLRFPGAEALVGLFDSDRSWQGREELAARTLARHLSLAGAGLRVTADLVRPQADAEARAGRAPVAGAPVDGVPAGGRRMGVDLVGGVRTGGGTVDGTASAGCPEGLSALTPRQWELARLVSLGLSNAQIAERLCLTEGSVKKHLTRIFERSGVRNRSALTAAVLRA